MLAVGSPTRPAGCRVWTVEVVVSLDADPGREVVIPLSVENQGGVSDADYSGVPDGVTFMSGVTEQRFVFSATQDMFDDDGEAVVLGFGALPEGVTVGTVVASTVIIADDDRQGAVASPESVEVLEGESAPYMVVLTAQPTEPVTISVIRPANPDITAEPEFLTFTMLCVLAENRRLTSRLESIVRGPGS